MSTDDALEHQLQDLHVRLLDGDPTASARLATLAHPALLAKLRGKMAILRDSSEAESVVGLSLAQYLTAPHRYDPARGPLLDFLLMDASGDLGTAYRLEQKLRKRLIYPEDDVVFERLAQNYEAESAVNEDPDPVLVNVVQSLNDQEREFAKLWEQDVRETSPFANVLGISHLPIEEQRYAVKIFKDALKKKMRRRYVALSGGRQ
jgi:hypothetical protein